MLIESVNVASILLRSTGILPFADCQSAGRLYSEIARFTIRLIYIACPRNGLLDEYSSSGKEEDCVMAVKFNQYWTIDYDKAKEYEKFVIRKYIPGLNKLGIHIVAGWTVLIGGYSENVLEGISNDLELLEMALRNKKYRELNDELHNYIKKYKTKVLVSTGKKDHYSKDIEKNTIKFSQTWDVFSRTKDQYERYVTETFYPCMEILGIQVAREWEVLIGDGPRVLCEGRAQDVDSSTLISNLQGKKFQEAKRGLKQFVENYESRILTFHIQKVLGYKSASYELITG
jgi:hypothetical protein